MRNGPLGSMVGRHRGADLLRGMLLALFLVNILTSWESPLAEEPLNFSQVPVPQHRLPIPSTTQAIDGEPAQDAWVPEVNEELSRGLAAELYPVVAPATVVVRTSHGHGTGFIIDDSGWVVTNFHVVDGADIDPKSGALRVMVNRGRLGAEGYMELEERPLSALVQKFSRDKDLALLWLEDTPNDLLPLPTILLSERGPEPGGECIALGHPAAGMLWTLRTGQIAGVGKWPTEMIDVVMARLATSDADRQEFDAALKGAKQRTVVLSTCGLNPGDSGGPLVDQEGRLVAVTFAIPRNPGHEGISLDKFSYHVHLDELKGFLADRPASPQVFIPEPWPKGMFGAPADLDGDKQADVWWCWASPDEDPVGLLADLDRDSAKKARVTGGFSELRPDQWDFEFAYRPGSQARAFYDTDNDGQVDLILTGGHSGQIEHALRFAKDEWSQDDSLKGRILDARYFTDQFFRDRFAAMVRLLKSNADRTAEVAARPQSRESSEHGDGGNKTAPKAAGWSTWSTSLVSAIIGGLIVAFFVARRQRRAG